MSNALNMSTIIGLSTEPTYDMNDSDTSSYKHSDSTSSIIMSTITTTIHHMSGVCGPHERQCADHEDHCTIHGVCCIGQHTRSRCVCDPPWEGDICNELPHTANSQQMALMTAASIIGAVIAVLVIAAFLLFIFCIYITKRQERLEKKKKRESMLQVETDALAAEKKKNETGKCPKLQPGFSWRERTIKKSIARLQSRMSAPVDLDKLDLITNMNSDGAGRPTTQWINTDATRPTSLWLDQTPPARPTSNHDTPCATSVELGSGGIKTSDRAVSFATESESVHL